MPYSGAGLSGTSAQSDNALAASDGGMWGCYDSNVHRCAGEPQMTHSPCVELSEAPCTRLGYPQHWAIACARDPHGRDRSATRSTTDRAAASRELCSHSTRWGRPKAEPTATGTAPATPDRQARDSSPRMTGARESTPDISGDQQLAGPKAARLATNTLRRCVVTRGEASATAAWCPNRPANDDSAHVAGIMRLSSYNDGGGGRLLGRSLDAHRARARSALAPRMVPA